MVEESVVTMWTQGGLTLLKQRTIYISRNLRSHGKRNICCVLVALSCSKSAPIFVVVNLIGPLSSTVSRMDSSLRHGSLSITKLEILSLQTLKKSILRLSLLSNILSQPIHQDIPFDTFNRKVDIYFVPLQVVIMQ